MRIAVVTCEDCPYPAPDDGLLLEALSALGAIGERVAWSAPSVDWRSFDAAVVRSTWDYHLRLPEFLDWTDRVATMTKLMNPSETIRWNSHKFYLRELEAKGIRIVPTEFVPSGSPFPDLDWQTVVIKPAVAASAYETIVAEAGSDAAKHHLDQLSKTSDVLIQPYLNSVERGEISLMFIDGEFSHAALKRPQNGDFRVQIEHGGTIEHAQASEAEMEVATVALEALDEKPLFARFDFLNLDSGEPTLSELELIEPDLMMQLYPQAAHRLAEAIMRSVEKP